jgi:hypothetical protein
MSLFKCNFFNCSARQTGIIFYAFIAFFLTSCSGLQVKPDPSNPIRRIAVLPLYNKTAQKGGAGHVRRELLKRLDMFYYEILPPEKTDEILRDNGLSPKGINFKNSDLKKLKKAFDVEGLVFGTLLNYDVHQKGTVKTKRVAGEFWLVDLTKGDDVWHESLGIKTESILEKNSSLIENNLDWGQASEMLPVSGGEVPFDNMDMNIASSFNTAPSYKSFEGNRHEMPKWVDSDFCKEQFGERLFEEDIKNKLACEVDELIQRVTWTFPVGPGIESKLDAK